MEGHNTFTQTLHHILCGQCHNTEQCFLDTKTKPTEEASSLQSNTITVANLFKQLEYRQNSVITRNKA